MALYTFILEYAGGTYIAQVRHNLQNLQLRNGATISLKIQPWD
jgi:hypothetical protein